MKKNNVYEAKKALLGSSNRERTFRRINDDKFLSNVLSCSVSEFKQGIVDISNEIENTDKGRIDYCIGIIYENFSDIISVVDEACISDRERIRRMLAAAVISVLKREYSMDKIDDDMITDSDYIAIIISLRRIYKEIYASKGKNFSKPDSSNDDDKDENSSDKNKNQDSSNNDDDKQPKGILGKWLKIAEKYQSVVPGSAEETEADEKQKECINDILFRISTYDKRSKFDDMSKKEIWKFAAWASEQIYCMTDDVKHIANGKNDMSQLCSLLSIMQGGNKKQKKNNEQKKNTRQNNGNNINAKLWEVIKNAPVKEADFISAINEYIAHLPKNNFAFNNRARGYKTWFGKWLFARMNAKDKFIEQIINRESDKLQQVIAVINYKEDRDKPGYTDKLFGEYLNRIRAVPSDDLMVHAMAHAYLLHEIS